MMSSRDKINVEDLWNSFKKLDGRGYKKYRVLRHYIIVYPSFHGYFTRIQGDPYAPPSIFETRIPFKTHGLRNNLLNQWIPLTDYIYRLLYHSLRRQCVKCGSGNSCYLGIPSPSPAILPRSGVEIHGSTIILRFYVGLPARGRKILGDKAYKLLVERIPKALSFIEKLVDHVEDIREHIEIYNDHGYIVKWLEKNGYIVFIGDNSILPRESSISSKPYSRAKPFRSPLELRHVIRLPSGRTISGMVIPCGVTIITGGGYHGKSTLLDTIAEAIYPHIKGDGREYVVSNPMTFYVEAENGRIVSCVDISSFVDGEKMPVKITTECFTTLNASGSTSMAASINEVLELGAKLLLIDEDTSATNLLYRDNVMDKIIRVEPIKPLNKQIKSLVEKTKTSLIIVSTASSTYLRLADTIILMENYIPKLIKTSTNHVEDTIIEYIPPRKRRFRYIRDLVSLKAREHKLVAKYRNREVYEIDLKRNKRIVEKGQVKMIAILVEFINNNYRDKSIDFIIREIRERFAKKKFRGFIEKIPPDLVWVDPVDAIWVMNRLYNTVFEIIM